MMQKSTSVHVSYLQILECLFIITMHECTEKKEEMEFGQRSASRLSLEQEHKTMQT